ncbi:MAG: lytic transglycosylase domain-containing protein [Bacteroidales bacterium]|nr:lytic transglycosylase domain-containing protein [Bacteroidales bacterium]
MLIKWIVRVFAGIGIITILFVMIGLMQDYNQDDQTLAERKPETIQRVKSFELPDSLSFAGERVPLENFDTRESLDRELNSNAYFHSATMLLIKRAHRYFPVIEPILEEYGIPDDFKYLAVAESNLSNAISPVGATGFWQFMNATAKEYGLEINREVDERYHIEKSTAAACRYFLKSYRKYGSWTMVAASYNRGSRGVDQLIDIQGQNDYYDLLLPEETSRYLFRILAFKTIFTEPVKYGFDIPDEHLYPPLQYIIVSVDTTVNSFAEFAGVFGTNYKILKAFNPWLRQAYLNNRTGKSYEIKIPVDGLRTKAYE